MEFLDDALTQFRSEVKNIDHYINSVTSFYNLLTQLAYKQAVNKLAAECGHPLVYPEISEEKAIKIAAATLNEEIKKLPPDMIRPGVVEQVEKFLE